MTLVKTKKRPSAGTRKANGEHHRKNDKYTKTYWPYIPVLFILGSSVFASTHLASSSGSGYSSRAGELFGSNSFLILAGLYVALALLVTWYAVRHFKRIKTLIVGGEHVLARHYTLDVLAGLLIGTLFVLVS